MRKLTLSALTLLIISIANAQFKAGDRYLSGSFSFTGDKNDLSNSSTTKQFNISISPAFTKFKTDKKATGGTYLY